MSSPVKAALTEEDKDEDADCRLRYALNPDCLTEIFKYLDQYDLLTLSTMNSHYKEIIVHRIIPTIQLKLHEDCDHNKRLMGEFGETVKSIKFKGDKDAFETLMQSIHDYCLESQLLKLDISPTERSGEKIGNFDICNSNLVNRTKKYLRKLNFVAIDEKNSNWDIPQNLFDLSRGIRVLELKNLNIRGKFQNWTGFVELTDLTLIKISGFKKDKFIKFLNRCPRLERFSSDDLDFNMGEAIAEHCGKTIRAFGDLRIFSEIEIPQTRYDFLDKFENLKEAVLTSEYVCMSDLYRPLMLLALKGSIETLEIKQVETKYFRLEKIPDLPTFKKLTTFKLSIREREHEADELDEELHSKFILNNAKKILTNVQALHLSGAFTKNMSTIIRLTTKLKRLWIHELEARHLMIQARRIVACIGQVISERTADSVRRQTNNLVYVTVCGEQWRDYAVFERIPITLLLKGKRKADMRNFGIAGTAKIPKPF